MMKRTYRHPRLWDDFFGFDDLQTRNMGRFPATNIREQEDAFVLEMAVPGRKKSDIQLHVEKDILTVSSAFEDKHEEQQNGYRHREFRFAGFKRSFRLPEHTNLDAISATYTDGILQISLPKKEGLKVQKEITIA